MAKLKKLEYISMNSCVVNGSLTDIGIDQMSALTGLVLEDNEIIGTIPDLKQNNLWQFDVSSNMIEGTIPESVGTLPQLHILDLSRNKLTGSIPYTFAHLAIVAKNPPGYASMDLSNNFLSGVVPDIGWGVWHGYPGCDSQPSTDPSNCCRFGNNADFMCPFPDNACFDDSGLHGGFPTCKNRTEVIV